MTPETKKHSLHLSALIAAARLEKGYATLKELYREKNPLVDYQSWLHAESGRRIPTPETLIEIGTILEIDRQDLLIAYCRDKFADDESQKVLESFQYKKFADIETLIDAKDHDQTDDYVLNAEQVEAIKKDLRLRLFLTYTYDQNYKSTVSKFEKFFKSGEEEVREVLAKLKSLGLVEVSGDEVTRIQKHTTIPRTSDTFDLRKKLLIKNLEINIAEDSFISSNHVGLTESSVKNMLSFFHFVDANLIKMDKEDRQKKRPVSRFQVAIVVNKVKDGGCP